MRNSLVYMRRLRGNFTFKFEIMRHIYIYIHITYKRISDFIYFSHKRLLTICIVVVGGRRRGFKLILAIIWFPLRLLSIPCFNLPLTPSMAYPLPPYNTFSNVYTYIVHKIRNICEILGLYPTSESPMIVFTYTY